MTTKTIHLLNGPYNGQSIPDSGAVRIRMSLYDGGMVPGATAGEAIYEPDPTRQRAFWLENHWDGTLEAVVE